MGVQTQASLTHRRDSEELGCLYWVIAEPSYLLSQGLRPTLVLHSPNLLEYLQYTQCPARQNKGAMKNTDALLLIPIPGCCLPLFLLLMILQ